MPKPISFGKLDFKIVTSMEDAHGAPEPETPFRIAVMGDFSGRASRGIFDPGRLDERRPMLVDRDNIDEVMEKLGVEIRLSILGKESPPIELRFRAIDDFHPDSLVERIGLFQSLRDMWQGLKDPSTFALLAKEMEGKTKPAEPSAPRETTKQSRKKAPTKDTGDLLDRIVEEQEGEGPAPDPRKGASGWDRFLQEIVAPHAFPDIEKKQAEMLANVNAAAGELLRMILHHPDFQEMEAAWRGVAFLISRLETGDELKVYLLDISKAELAADLWAKEDLRSAGVYKLLVERTVETFGGEPWAVLAGNYTFDQSRDDAELLGRLAKIARQAGAPFIAAASPRLLGCESLVKTPSPDGWKMKRDPEAARAWAALRKLSEASCAGLVLPRFLLRLPYGALTDAIERFDFEEMEGKPEHEHYLWGNPSFTLAYLLGQAFSDYGWGFRPGIVQDIEGLPLHVYKEQGESRAKPCAEVLLTVSAAEAMLERGLMPLLSFKDRDMIRLGRLQSVTDPPTPLSGRWGAVPEKEE